MLKANILEKKDGTVQVGEGNGLSKMTIVFFHSLFRCDDYFWYQSLVWILFAYYDFLHGGDVIQ